jgi:hypothetical protein
MFEKNPEIYSRYLQYKEGLFFSEELSQISKDRALYPVQTSGTCKGMVTLPAYYLAFLLEYTSLLFTSNCFIFLFLLSKSYFLCLSQTFLYPSSFHLHVALPVSGADSGPD